jgi:hypothetical protein
MELFNHYFNTDLRDTLKYPEKYQIISHNNKIILNPDQEGLLLKYIKSDPKFKESLIKTVASGLSQIYGTSYDVYLSSHGNDIVINYSEQSELLYLPKELFEIIFLYATEEDLNTLFRFPEFQGIYNNNYFWYELIKYNYPKYYIENVKGYNFREVYHGLSFLYRPDITLEDIKKYPSIKDYIEYFYKIPNFLGLYLNFANVKKIRNMLYGEGAHITLEERRLILSLTKSKIDRLFLNVMQLLMDKYPEAFRYLIQNDLLKGSYIDLDNNKLKWILIFDDPKLINKLPLKYNTTQELFDTLLVKGIKSNIFDYLFKLIKPYPMVDDYLNLFKHDNIRESTIDHIVKLIGNVDSVKMYNFFYGMIMNHIHTYDLNYIWNKYRDLFSQPDKQRLRKISQQSAYLNEDDEYVGENMYRTFE